MAKIIVGHDACNLDNIPAELKALKQWCVWRIENNDPKKKVPKHAGTGETTGTNMPFTWSTFEVARDNFLNSRTGKYDGVGFMLSEEDTYTIIDLDKVIDKDGQIDNEAQEIIERLDSYTEISHSGHGIHIIVRGAKPGTRCRRKGIEIYDHKRYIALTGNLWQDRKTIEDRQEALDWLCEETFGETTGEETEPVSVDELVLDRDATPPTDRLDVLLKNRDFARTWKHKREDLKSLSDYDLSLAGSAYRAGWSDQEAADLIIAFRRQHGNDSDLKKALRQDYMKMTLVKVKPKADDTHDLSLLPFKVVKVKQYGESESTVTLVLDNGQEIDMGTTENFLSARRARARLWQADYDLPIKAEKRWREITKSLIALKEKISTITRAESTRAWLDDYISSRISLPTIESEEDIKRLFGSGLHSIAMDKQDRAYLRLSDVARYARLHTGMGGVTQKDVAKNLIELGFKKHDKVSVIEDGKRRQINLWVSPAGFIGGAVE